MNLQEVTMHRGFRPACYGCGFRMDHTVKVYADLHGPAFQAYYCTPCAQDLRARENMRPERRQRTSDRRRADPDRYRKLRLRGGTPSDKRAWWGPTEGGRRATDKETP